MAFIEYLAIIIISQVVASFVTNGTCFFFHIRGDIQARGQQKNSTLH